MLEVIDGLEMGGAEKLLITLARHIDRSRFDLHVFTMRPVNDSVIVNDLRALSIPMHGMGSVRLRDVHLLPRFVRWVRTNEIDVVHTHLGLSDTWAGVGGWLAGRPVVSTVHIVRDDPQRFGAAKTFLRCQVLRKCSSTVVLSSPSMVSTTSRNLHIAAHRLVEIPNCIDIESFEHVDAEGARALRTSFLGEREGPLIVTVGNTRTAKGHEYLVSAARIIVDRFPGAIIVIVGRRGDNDDEVRRHIVELKLQGRVVMPGERHDIPEILAAADLFVLPSLYEGLPLALLEAMGAGKPVVATDVDGVAGVVDDGVTGLLIPPRNSEALAGAAINLLCHPERAVALGAAASSHVRKHYRADVWTQRLETLYVGLAASRGSGQLSEGP